MRGFVEIQYRSVSESVSHHEVVFPNHHEVVFPNSMTEFDFELYVLSCTYIWPLVSVTLSYMSPHTHTSIL